MGPRKRPKPNPTFEPPVRPGDVQDEVESQFSIAEGASHDTALKHPPQSTLWSGGTWPRRSKSTAVTQVAKESITAAARGASGALSTATTSNSPVGAGSIQSGIDATIRSESILEPVDGRNNDAPVLDIKHDEKIPDHSTRAMWFPRLFPQRIEPSSAPGSSRASTPHTPALSPFNGTVHENSKMRVSSQPQQRVSDRKEEPEDLNTVTQHDPERVSRRSWLGFWGASGAVRPEDSLISDVGNAEETTRAAAKSNEAEQGIRPEESQQPTSGWAFWSRDNGTKELPPNHGKLALANSPSQRYPLFCLILIICFSTPSLYICIILSGVCLHFIHKSYQ